MTNISGHPSAYVAFARQSAKGTPNTTAGAFVFAKYLSGTDFQPTSEFLGPVREGGDGLDHRFDMRVSHVARGAVTVHARPEIFGLLSAAFFGAGRGGQLNASSMASGPGVGSNLASHVFQFPVNPRDTYWTVVVAHPGGEFTQVLTDARPVTYMVEGENRQPVKMTTEWMGLQYGASWGTALTAAYEAANPWGFFDASFSFPFGGSAASFISQYSINAQIEIDEDLYTTGLTMLDTVDLSRTVEISCREVWQNPTVYNHLEYAGGVAPTFGLSTGIFKVAHAAGASRIFTIDANLVRWADAEIGQLDPDNKVVYLEHRGVAFAGATSSLVVNVSNGRASSYLAS